MVWDNSKPPCPTKILYPKEVKTTWFRVKPAESGLINQNNSCFLNASLQALFHLPGFLQFLEEDHLHRSSCFSLLNCVICGLYRSYLNMSLHPIFKPLGLFNLLPRLNPRFKRGQQEDAHEFLVFFLDLIDAELLKRNFGKLDYCSQQTTAMGQIFSWWTVVKDTCADCPRTTQTYASVRELSLPISAGSVQLAVTEYMEEVEIISDFQCVVEECPKINKMCHRSIAFHTYPKVLKIVLNRFKFHHNSRKILSPVKVERSITIEKATYHFVSGIIHEGPIATAGHYTCIAVRSDGKLASYNDSIVTTENVTLTSDKTERGIYILFYQLHHFKADSIKRSVPNTPSKCASPLHKKVHVASPLKSPLKSPMKSLEKKKKGKLKIFNPRNLKRKLGEFFGGILPTSTNKSNEDADALAQPLAILNEKPVEVQGPSVALVKRRKSLVSNRSTSSLDVSISELVTPMRNSTLESPASQPVLSKEEAVLNPSIRCPVLGASTPGQSCRNVSSKEEVEIGAKPACVTPPSSHPSEETQDALVTPIKVKLKPASTSTPSSHPSEETQDALVTPIKVKLKPASTSTPSSHPSEATADAVVTPIRISMRPGPLLECRNAAGCVSAAGALVTPLHTSSIPNLVREQKLPQIPKEAAIQFKALVPPIKITRKPRTVPKSRDSQSSHEYTVNPLPEPNQHQKLFPNDNLEEISPMEQGSFLHDFNSSPPPFVPEELTTSDIPGADLPNPDIEKNTVAQLKTWLKLQGIPVGGTKPVLVKKVKNYIARGQHNVINPKGIGGKFSKKTHTTKGGTMEFSQDLNRLQNSDIFHSEEWDLFPSRDIPSSFNFGSVFHYLVETMPQLENSEEGSNGESSGDEEVEEEIQISDPFQDAESKAIKLSKKLRRGLAYVKSKYVQNVQDALTDNIHIYKGLVRASMNKRAYAVKVALSQISGSVLKCSCDISCPQKGLGRCSHVSALLLHILLHKNLNGPAGGKELHLIQTDVCLTLCYAFFDHDTRVSGFVCRLTGSKFGSVVHVVDFGHRSLTQGFLDVLLLLHDWTRETFIWAITCTSRPNTWNHGSLEYNPEIANERQYDSFKINVIRRATFDPRPTRYQTGYPTQKQKNDFYCALLYKESESLFQTLLVLRYEEFDYDDVEKAIFREKRDQLYDSMKQQLHEWKPSPQHTGAFEVKGTTSQSGSRQWHVIRALHCSAQPSHQVAHFQAEKAKMNFLRKHLWGIDNITTKAMTYGKRNEPKARKKYEEEQLMYDPTIVVQECGLFLNTEYVGLSCSPDGIRHSQNDLYPRILLEIKCIYSLRDHDPNKFDEVWSQKKINNFCLRRDPSTGELHLKENHAYYDQIQFSLGLLDLPECHLFLWTEINSITITVSFDEDRWLQLKESSLNFHWSYLAPEYFAMRAPRKLQPQKIEEEAE